MRLLLSQITEKNTDRSARMDTLTRELINDAIAQELQLTADAVRALCVDIEFEDEYTELATDLINHREFQEATQAGHVTYGMVKPHVNTAKEENKSLSDDEVAEAIISEIESPLQPTIVRHTFMPEQVAQIFYDNLRGKRGSDEIFNRVTEFMSGGAITGLVLLNEEGDAIQEWRNQIGATNPTEAAEGTIRKIFADSIENNVVHGSDSAENAQREMNIFVGLL